MGLDDIVNDEKEESDFKIQENDDSSSEETSEDMYMEKIKDDYGIVRCPTCGEPGEETEHWYWRCRTDSCETVTFIHPEYEFYGSNEDEDDDKDEFLSDINLE